MLLALSGDAYLLLHAGPPVLLVAAGIWAAFWLPSLEADEDGVVVRNPLRTHRMPWSAVTGVVVDWQLAVLAGSRKVTVWALPREARPVRSYMRAGEDVTATSATAVAARLITEELESRRGEPTSGEVRTRWNVVVVLVLAALAVASVVSLFT